MSKNDFIEKIKKHIKKGGHITIKRRRNKKICELGFSKIINKYYLNLYEHYKNKQKLNCISLKAHYEDEDLSIILKILLNSIKNLEEYKIEFY